MMQSLIPHFQFLETLDKSIKTVEIIDDLYELTLFKKVNGNTENN